MKVLPYPLQAKLELVITWYIHGLPNDVFPEQEFRNALFEILKRTPPTVGQLYDTQRPLLLEVARLREEQEIAYTPYIRSLTNIYVETLKECLKDNRLGTRPSRTSTTSAPIVPSEIPESNEQIQKDHWAPRDAKNKIGRAPNGKQPKILKQPKPVKDPKPVKAPKPVKERKSLLEKIQEEMPCILLLDANERASYQKLSTALLAREFTRPAWSQIITFDAVEYTRKFYLSHLDFLLEVVTVLDNFPQKQIWTHKKQLRDLHTLLLECKAATLAIHPMVLRAQEQQTSQRYASHCIQKVTFELSHLLERLENKWQKS